MRTARTHTRRTGLAQRVAVMLLAALCTGQACMAQASMAQTAAAQTEMAQTTLTPAAGNVQADGVPPTALHIDILEGEGALNNIRERNTREPIVQVEDQNHKPVAGVLVLFTLHGGVSGAGGTVNGLTSFSMVTGADGRAQLHGLAVNQTPGSYTISVTASVGTVTAEATIHESNVSGPGQPAANTETAGSVIRKSSVKRNLLFFGGAALVVSLLIVLDRQHGTTITTGTGTVHP